MSATRLLLPLTIVLALFPLAHISTQGQFTPVDNEVVPGPGDSMVVVDRGRAQYTLTVSTTTNTVFSHRVDAGGELTLTATVLTGDGPRAIAAARDGRFAVIVNSDSDNMTVVNLAEDGILTFNNQVPSGGDNPFDVAVAWDDLVIVANRDSADVVLFQIDRDGNMTQIGDPHPTGIDPHVIAVSPRGLVAVANSTSNDLTLFDLDRKGNMSLVNPSFNVGNSPKAVAFGKSAMFVATRSPAGQEDQIQAYQVTPGKQTQLVPAVSAPGGVFLTDLDVNDNLLFAVTLNPLTGLNQVRAFDVVHGTQLVPGAVLETAGPPSFKTIASAPMRGPLHPVLFVSDFQAGVLRSIVFTK